MATRVKKGLINLIVELSLPCLPYLLRISRIIKSIIYLPCVDLSPECNGNLPAVPNGTLATEKPNYVTYIYLSSYFWREMNSYLNQETENFYFVKHDFETVIFRLEV